MSNPNPKIDHLTSFPRQIASTESCAPKPVQVRVLKSDYEEWMKIPVEERNAILRTVISSTVQQRKQVLAS